MALTKYKLGDLIQQRREKYDGVSNLPIRGVSKDGFIDAKQPGANTSLYNTYYKYDFVFNPARMEINSIALNTEYEKAICSSLYEIFFVQNTNILLPEYLNLFVKRGEFARLCEFIGWGSAREYCRVGDISDIDIFLPPLSVQQKYVDVYNSMLANQRNYERGLENLRQAVFAEIDIVKHSADKVPVGDLLEEIDVRNTDGSITNIQGINIEKQFMPSVADTASVNIRNYKVVREGQFAYSSMQTGRDECIRIALYDKDTPILISPAYSVLRVKESSAVAEYIMLWFTRPETDRYGWFASDASVRANLDLDRFFEIQIPMPDTAKQQAIANIYIAYMLRREINEQLKAQIRDICPILIKGSLKEAMTQGG